MKILRYLLTSLGILLTVVACCTVLLLHWSAFGWKALSIPTGSMRPTLPPGTLVLIHRVPDSSLRVGDVITYISPLNPRETISHRIIKEYLTAGKVPTFITKGDANKSADVPVVEGLVQGEVAWHLHDAGWLLIWSKTWLGIIVLIYIPSLLIIYEELLRLKDYYKQSVPYRLFGYAGHVSRTVATKRRTLSKSLTSGIAVALAIILISGAAAPTAYALLRSNEVALVHNELVVAKISRQKGTCTSIVNSNNSVTINNSTSQNAASGSATINHVSSQSTSVSTGNATNTNNTSITVNTSNCQ